MREDFGTSLHQSGKYESYLMVNGQKVYLGLFPTLKLAHRARKGAKRALEAATATWR